MLVFCAEIGINRESGVTVFIGTRNETEKEWGARGWCILAKGLTLVVWRGGWLPLTLDRVAPIPSKKNHGTISDLISASSHVLSSISSGKPSTQSVYSGRLIVVSVRRNKRHHHHHAKKCTQKRWWCLLFVLTETKMKTKTKCKNHTKKSTHKTHKNCKKTIYRF